MLTRPMLAAKAGSPEDVWFPCCATPKIDGIRAIVHDGCLVSRAFKPIRNTYIQECCAALPYGLDGELVTPGSFQDTSSAVMSFDGRPDFKYLVFDQFGPGGYLDRIQSIQPLPDFCEVLYPVSLWNLDDLLRFEESCLTAGYEGIVTRSAVGPYECKRSTLRTQNMVKFKRTHDSEAIVLAVYEGQTNLNPIVPNAFGLARRPGGSSGKVPRGTVGSLLCRDVYTGVEVNVGSGFTDEQRDWMWENPPIGCVLTYTYQKVGVKDAPRFPRFKGWRLD